jgi:hypothetical protein
MKSLVLTLMVMYTLSSFSQWGGERTSTWFDFPDSKTLDSPRLIRVQHNLFIDPLGKAPSGRGGRQLGYEFTAIMGLGYIAPSISTFPQLEDGYTDVIVTVGINWHMFQTTLIRYYGGYRNGLEFRGDAHYNVMGMSLGADVQIYKFSDGSSIHLGGELWVDYRASQDNKWYGDSDAYKEGLIFTNPMTQENGKLKIGYRF